MNTIYMSRDRSRFKETAHCLIVNCLPVNLKGNYRDCRSLLYKP